MTWLAIVDGNAALFSGPNTTFVDSFDISVAAEGVGAGFDFAAIEGSAT